MHVQTESQFKCQRDDVLNLRGTSNVKADVRENVNSSTDQVKSSNGIFN